MIPRYKVQEIHDIWKTDVNNISFTAGPQRGEIVWSEK